jgi:SAM-dependent methyltransferase
MDRDEYRRMVDAETSHWWYAETRALLGAVLAPHLRGAGQILDAGCGTGATGGWLARHGTVVGMDAERLALDLYRDSRPSIRLVSGAIEHLPFASQSFDLALCVTVLCHEMVQDPIDGVRELARVVRPGGVVCLMEPGVRRLRRAHDRITHTKRRFSLSDLRRLLVAAGLTPLRTTGAYSFLVPPALVKALLERGRAASDLSSDSSGLAGVLPAFARLERAWLARRNLPGGLSVIGVAVK